MISINDKVQVYILDGFIIGTVIKTNVQIFGSMLSYEIIVDEIHGGRDDSIVIGDLIYPPIIEQLPANIVEKI